jgi:hypothetical protein
MDQDTEKDAGAEAQLIDDEKLIASQKLLEAQQMFLVAGETTGDASEAAVDAEAGADEAAKDAAEGV